MSPGPLPAVILLACLMTPLTASDLFIDRIGYDLDGRLSMQGLFYHHPHASFRLGELRSQWDRADRYELHLIYLYPLNQHVEAMGGGSVFWEDRSYRRDGAHVDYSLLGFSWEAGVVLYPLPGGSMAPINLGIMPYSRIGLGTQNATFAGIPYDPDLAHGTVKHERWEFALGVDARLSIARHLHCTLGVGVQAWYTDRSPATRFDSDGNEIGSINPLPFQGEDVWIRFGLGLQF